MSEDILEQCDGNLLLHEASVQQFRKGTRAMRYGDTPKPCPEM